MLGSNWNIPGLGAMVDFVLFTNVQIFVNLYFLSGVDIPHAGAALKEGLLDFVNETYRGRLIFQ